MKSFSALALSFCLGATSSAQVETRSRLGPFEAASVVPADVTLYVHVENAASLRRELSDRPIARWLMSVFENGHFHKAWKSLATTAQLDQGRLFDLCAGRRFTLASRGPDQWALITEIDASQIERLLASLKARVRNPKAGMGIYELPEQEIIVALDGRRLVIGPSRQSGLFYEVLPSLAEPRRGWLGDSLAGTPELIRAKAIGAGSIGVFCRHAQPMGGCSAVVADLQGDQLMIHHSANFDNAPFEHGVTQLTCDFSPVSSLGDRALVAMMQPTDIGDGPVESFVTASFGEALISPEMRASLGTRRLMVIAEEEGRQLEKPVDLLSTTVAACLELKDGAPGSKAAATKQLDEQMIKICRRINDRCKGTLLDKPPDVHRMCPRQPREVDLSAAADWFSGGFPIMKNVSLNWTVADGPEGSWFVIASHRRSLDDVVSALSIDSPNDARMIGRFDSCGVGNGSRIERHLRSWSDAAEKFAEPAKVKEFRDTLGLMSELAGGLRRCRWQLARPSANEMRLDIQIELVPPESARVD
jgi:hypothetical protein